MTAPNGKPITECQVFVHGKRCTADVLTWAEARKAGWFK